MLKKKYLYSLVYWALVALILVVMLISIRIDNRQGSIMIWSLSSATFISLFYVLGPTIGMLFLLINIIGLCVYRKRRNLVILLFTSAWVLLSIYYSLWIWRWWWGWPVTLLIILGIVFILFMTILIFIRKR